MNHPALFAQHLKSADCFAVIGCASEKRSESKQIFKAAPIGAVRVSKRRCGTLKIRAVIDPMPGFVFLAR
jgi:hypothetical protein